MRPDDSAGAWAEGVGADGRAASGPGRPRGLEWGIVLALGLATATIFAWNVRAGWFLGDDGFISFRYARHLAEGQGLVWNPGERVEGYTNFLWVVLMAGGMRLGAAPEAVSNLIGVASGLLVLGMVLLFAARGAGWRSPFVWLAPLALALGRSFTAWCTGGLETMFFTLLVLAATFAFVREREARSEMPIASSILFSLATLTRPEGGLFAAVAFCFHLVDVAARRRTLRSALIWAFPCVDVVGAHLVWRHVYYGAWLPNSFYAKVAGAWWDQGLRYLRLFAEDYRIVWFAPLALLPLLRRERFTAALLLSMSALYLVYLAYVGGDRFEYRFLVVVLPFFCLLVAEGLRWVAALPIAGRAPRLVGLALALFAGSALLLATWRARDAPAPGRDHSGVASLDDIKAYAARRTEEGRFLRGLVDEGLLPPDLVLCVGGAGALPYYTDWPTVDRRGINDAMIARMPVEERGVIGHEHDAPYDYLVQRRVVLFDVFNQVVHAPGEGDRFPDTVRHEGRVLPVRIVEAKGRELLFATLVPEPEFRRIFSRLQILR